MFEDSRKPTSVKEILAVDLAPQMYEVWSLHYDKILPDWSKMPQTVKGFWIDKATMALAFLKLEKPETLRASNDFHVDVFHAVLAASEPQNEHACWIAVCKFLLEKI
tara:strand:- start:104 stop:424 length:321 start_codon:yes stop_codon:yes gene_type:complete